MTPLYEQKWFIAIITQCRKSAWFDRWIWGYSANMEDFVRNSGEELRDNFFPFAVMNVSNPTSVALIRLGFTPYSKDKEQDYFNEVMAAYPQVTPDMIRGTYKRIPLDYSILYDRIGIWNTWVTKYPNAGFMFQLLASFKWGFIPIPFVAMNIRFSKVKYFQFGFGWSPQWRNYNGRYPGDESTQAVLSAKFRIGSYLKELEWNPGSEVYGYWEGAV
jgi:hypothetical protein